LQIPCAVAVHSSGSRINNGLSNGFFNVVIVAEPGRLYDYEIGALADYITMLALSQPASLDACQVLPSISNMLAGAVPPYPAGSPTETSPICAHSTKCRTEAGWRYNATRYASK
jgi:hypothetical protein